MSERDVYSVPEVAARLGVDRNTAYQAIKEGQIPSIRVGHRILVPRAAFERLLEQGNAA
jgi:excisionase family DNA binding protein